MRYRGLFAVVLLFAVLVTSPVAADVINLGASKDNTLYENATGSISNGAGQHIFAGRVNFAGGGALRRAVIAFDIAGSLPAGSTIENVQLTLNMSRTRFGSGARNTDLYPVLSDWGEGTSNAPFNEGTGTTATTGDATWLHTFFNSVFWTSPGGDFPALSSATVAVDGLGSYTWGSTAAMVADVQQWLDSPASNFGWILIGDESVLGTAKRFDSHEHPTASVRPVLGITFTVPAVSGACCDDLSGICDDGIDQSACLTGGGRFGGEDSTCLTIDPACDPSGACCDDSTGVCENLVTQASCEGAGLRYGGDGSTCATIDPACVTPSIGACCDEVLGVCTDNVEQDTCESSGGRFGGDGSDCATLDPACQGSGACCDDTTGVCSDGVFESECFQGGFRYGGNTSTCATIDPPCTGPPRGACCVELRGECLESVLPEQCAAEGGRYGGDGTTCSTVNPPCEPVLTIGLELVAGSPAGAARGTGLNSPLRVTHAGDGSGRLFIVDQTGQIHVVKDGVLLGTPFLDIAAKMVVLSPGFDERGLLGLAFHPNYAANGRFFVRYSADRVGTPGEPCCANMECTVGCHKEVLAEFKQCILCPSDPNIADPNTEIILFEVDEPEFNHNAGDIAFGPDGLLYFSLGDGGGANDGLDDPKLPHGPIGNGQDIDTLLGSVLRIDVDAAPDAGLAYHIPIDNPFVGTVGADEIFAYGFRNPYSFSFDDGPGGDGRLYVGDVGQALFEEINIVNSGGNYGWVLREGAHCFDPSDPATPPASCPSVGTVLGDPLIDPVMEYLQPIPCANDAGCAAFGVGCGSDGLCLDHGGISIMAGHVYRGSKLPALVGKFIFGDFDASAGGFDGRLYYFDTTGLDLFQRREFDLTPASVLGGLFIKGMGEDESGDVYVCVSASVGPFGGSGGIFRVTAPVPSAIGGGARYVSVTVPDGPDPVGIVVTPNCPAGVPKYVGAPGDPDNTAVLVNDPLQGAFLTKAEWGGTVHVTDTEIVPSSSYRVQIDTGSPGFPALSGAATATTAKWGDSVGPFADGVWTPPDGLNDVSDILAVIQAFVSAPNAPPIFQADMQGAVDLCTPDRQIDIVDALDAVAGFQGFDYTGSFPQCPQPCP